MTTIESPAEPQYGDLAGTDRVAGQLYTDPAIFAEEMKKIFYRTWVWVAHESEIPEAGSFKTTQVGDQPVIVNRDRKGNFNTLLNRCRHRGATVCDQRSGKANGFTCPYHNWSYTLDGRLRGIPCPGRGAPAQARVQTARSAWREKSRSSSMSCPFAGMTRIRFKGSPQLRPLSSCWNSPRNEALM